jgi:hypothetical protein
VNPQYIKLTLAAASANNIALSQTVSGASNVVLNGSTATGGVATLDTDRRVLITNAGDDHLITFTVTGTGKETTQSFSETVTGTNGGTVATTQNFFKVTSIKTSGSTSGSGITVGTNGVGSSRWRIVNWHDTPINIGIGTTVTGTVNYTVEHTYDDVMGVYPNPNVTFPTVYANPTLNALTSNAEGVYTTPIAAYRITVNSGTGTVALTALNAGISGS